MSAASPLSDRQSRLEGWRQELIDGAAVAVLDNCGDDPIARRVAGWLVRCLAALCFGRLEIASEEPDDAQALARRVWTLNPTMEVLQSTIVDGVAPWFAGPSVEIRGRGRQPLLDLGGEPATHVIHVDADAVRVRSPDGAATVEPAAPSGTRGSAAMHALAEIVAAVVAGVDAWPGLTHAARVDLPVTSEVGDRPPLALFLAGAGAVANLWLVALDLAGIDVSVLHVADFDEVDPSNLGRQVLYDDDDARERRNKAEAFARRAGQLLGVQRVVAHPTAFEPAMMTRFAQECGPAIPLVGLFTDNWSGRLQAMDAAAEHGVPALYGGTSERGSKVRLMGPGVDESRCIGCGPERARERARGEGAPVRNEATSCSAGPGSSVLSNLQAAAAALDLVERYLAGRPTGRGVDSSLHGERRHRGVRLEPCDCLLGVPLGALVFDGQRSTVLRGRGADVPGFGSVIGADLPGLGDVGALVLLEPDRSVTREAGGSAEVGAIQLAAGERVLVDGSRWAALEPVPRFERADGPGRCSFCRGRTAAGSRVRICEEGHRSCADGCGEEGCPWCAGPAEGVA